MIYTMYMSSLLFVVLYGVAILGLFILVAIYFFISAFFSNSYSPYRHFYGKSGLAYLTPSIDEVTDKANLLAQLEEIDMADAAKEVFRVRKVQHRIYQIIVFLLCFISVAIVGGPILYSGQHLKVIPQSDLIVTIFILTALPFFIYTALAPARTPEMVAFYYHKRREIESAGGDGFYKLRQVLLIKGTVVKNFVNILFYGTLFFAGMYAIFLK